MKQLRRLINVFILLFLLLFIMGCPLGLFSPGDPDDPINTDDPTVFTSRVIIDELEENIIAAGFTSTQAIAISSSASSGEMAPLLGSVDLYLTMPLITAGAVAGLNDSSFVGDDIKINVLKLIMESLTSSLDGRDVQSDSFGRIIDPNADVMRAILAGISAAAISNLDTAGIAAERMADAAGATVGALVENLGNTGVTAEYISEATGDLVSAAVAGLAEVDGIDSNTAIAEAVQIIAENAVTALAAVEIDNFTETELPAVVGSIAQGITEAIDNTGSTDVISLIGPVTAGIADAAILITTDPAIFSSIVEETTTGATEGLAELQSSVTTADLIGEISAQTSKLFTIAAEDTTALSSVAGDIITLVVVGVAEGAANLDDTSLDTVSEIIAVLDLKDSDGIDIATGDVTDIDLLVQDGIDQASNEPPVIVLNSSEQVEAGNSITITATASDADGDVLEVVWSIVSGPEPHDGNFLSGSDALQTVFTTSVPGEYQLKIEVSDSLVTVFKYVFLTVTPSSSMTARDQVDYGLLFITNTLERDYEAALIEFRKVDSSAGDIYAEARYWEAYCVNDIDGDAAADSLYQAIINDFSPSVWAAKSKVTLGWIRRNSEDNFTESLALANAVISEYSGDDSIEEAEALNLKGYIYLQLGDYTQATTFTEDSLNHPAVSAITSYWTSFNLCLIDKDQGNLATARTQFTALLANETLLASIDIFEKYNALRWTYNTAAWLEMDDNNLAAAIALYQQGIAYPGTPNWLKAWYYSEIGWRNRDYGNWSAAESAFMSAIATGDSEASDWAMMHLGWLYNEWSEVDSSIESKVLPAFLNAYNNAEEPKVIFRAGIAIGEHYMWRNDDNDMAITQFNIILNSNVSDYPYLEARTLQRIGHAYMRKGWDADDSVGDDYIGYFTTALSYSEQITFIRFPELEYDDTWIYYEALGDKGEALQQLDREDEALALFQSLIDDSGVDVNDKARFQYEIGRIHRHAGDDLWWEDDNYSGALIKYQDALDAYDLVAGYTEEDGISYVDDGYWQARSLLELGRTQSRMGEIYEYELENDIAAVDAYTGALDDLNIITEAAFPVLVSGDSWIFYEAVSGKIEALSMRNSPGDLDEALLLIDDMAALPGYNEEDALGLLNDIARAYGRIAEEHDWGLYSTDIMADYQAAFDAYGRLLQEAIDQNHPDGGEHAADAKTTIGQLYADLYRRIWRSQYESGVEFSVIENDFNNIFNLGESSLNEAVAFNVLGVFPENGRLASTAQMNLAGLYQDSANYFRERTNIFENGAVSADISNYYTMLTEAMAVFEDFLTKVDNGTWEAEDWVWSNAFEMLSEVLMDLIELSDQIGGPSSDVTRTDVENYVNRIYTLVSIATSAEFMERGSMAYIYKQVGEWLTYAGHDIRNAGFTMDIVMGGTTIAAADWSDHYGFAELYLEQVILNFGDVDEGWPQAEAYYTRGNLYKFWGDFLTEDGDTATAELYYQGALADFELTKTGGAVSGIFEDDWRQTESDNRIIEINAILAAPPFTP